VIDSLQEQTGVSTSVELPRQDVLHQLSSWLLQSDGSYQLQDPGSGDAISAQETLLYAYASKS
jgi:hypothetical protein